MIVMSVMVMIFEVTVSAMIPVVVVFDTAAFSLPVARIIPFAVVVRCHPMRSLVRRSSPIAFMPFVVFSQGIPVTLYPCEPWLRHWGDNGNYAGRRWRANHNYHGNLCFTGPSCD